MKLVVALAFLFPFLQADETDIRFQSDGIYVNGKKVEGKALTLTETPTGSILVSEKELETLTNEVSVTVGETGTVTLEPGIRAEHMPKGIKLTSRIGKGLRMISGKKSVIVGSPAEIERSGEDWILGESTRITSKTLQVQSTILAPKPLQKPAEPIEETVTPSQEELDFANRPRPRRETRFRRVFLEDPFLTGKMVDSVSLRQLDPVSPSGE